MYPRVKAKAVASQRKEWRLLHLLRKNAATFVELHFVSLFTYLVCLDWRLLPLTFTLSALAQHLHIFGNELVWFSFIAVLLWTQSYRYRIVSSHTTNNLKVHNIAWFVDWWWDDLAPHPPKTTFTTTSSTRLDFPNAVYSMYGCRTSRLKTEAFKMSLRQKYLLRVGALRES